jgi:hypothetical protein
MPGGLRGRVVSGGFVATQGFTDKFSNLSHGTTTPDFGSDPLAGKCWRRACALGGVGRGLHVSTSQLTLGRSPGRRLRRWGGAFADRRQLARWHHVPAGAVFGLRGTGIFRWARSGRTRRSALPGRWFWARSANGFRLVVHWKDKPDRFVPTGGGV